MNNDGVWSETSATIEFTLRPHFYRTIWFYALSGLVLLLAGWGGCKLRVKQLERRTRVLEAKVAERTAEVVEQKNELAQQKHQLAEMNEQLGLANENMLSVLDQLHTGAASTIIQAGTSSPVSPSTCSDCIDRVFHVVSSSVTASLMDLTVRHGKDAGGGLYNNGGTVNITNSIFSNNTAPGFSVGGGGLYNTSSGTVNITNSTFSDNSAGLGGGLRNSSGLVNITNSTFSGNFSAEGGGLRNDSGSTVTITGSTFSVNSAQNGGGISNLSSSTVTITNSTFSSNSANDFGGGIANDSTVTISNSTFFGNSAQGGGGGLWGGPVNSKSTIIANSPSGGNCGNFGTLNASGVNLDTDGTCPGFMQKTTAQLKLGPLQLNVPGATQTHALLTGSVAIDAANDCKDYNGSTVTTDQRGVSRPQGAKCDVGAFEAPAQGQPALIFTLQGAGSVCLTLNLRTRQYTLKTPRQTIAGIFTFRQSGQTIRFQSACGDVNRLSGWINPTTRTASATLTLPYSLGGQRFSFDILAAAPCL